MSWFYLIIAGIFEIIWAVSIKYTDSFTKLMPSVITIVAMVLSTLALGASLKSIPLSTAYTVWCGIGAAGTILAGIFLFGESMELSRLLFLLLIVVGVIGVKMTS